MDSISIRKNQTSEGACTLLDANGPALLAGVDAPPTLLKPNLFELWQVDRGLVEVTTEQDLGDVPLGDILAAARRARARGIAELVVSRGERGVLGLEADSTWHAWTVLDHPAVNAVGSGDALAAGLVLLFRPAAGLAFITWMLAIYFVVNGIAQTALGLKTRGAPGSGWEIFNGFVSVILGVLIYVKWPLSGAWAVGVLVGVHLIVSGWTVIGIGLAARSVVKEAMQD